MVSAGAASDSIVPSVFPCGFGYGLQPYDVGTPYGYSPQPIVFVPAAPPAIVQPLPREVRPVIVAYKQPVSNPSAPF